ncbi:MAG: lysoplasmalogenase [Actinomycetota bacterium]
MNSGALAAFIGAVVLAAIDWWSVTRGNKVVEYICKPGAAALFVVAATLIDANDTETQGWMVVALVFCIAGDVFLMLPRDAFVPGLASFAVAQVLFAVSFALGDVSAVRLAIALVLIAVTSFVLARRFIGALKRLDQGSLIPPIVVYMSVISAMVVCAIASSNVLGVVGALLFMASDSLIAEERFVQRRRWQPLTIIVTYHLALAGFVLSLV